jgi:hypothetical protein
MDIFGIIPRGMSVEMYLLLQLCTCFVPLALIAGFFALKYWIQSEVRPKPVTRDQLRGPTQSLPTAEWPEARRRAIAESLNGQPWLEWLDENGVLERLGRAMIATLSPEDSPADVRPFADWGVTSPLTPESWGKLARAFGVPPVLLQVQVSGEWQAPSILLATDVLRAGVRATDSLPALTPDGECIDLQAIESAARSRSPEATACRLRIGGAEWTAYPLA